MTYIPNSTPTANAVFYRSYSRKDEIGNRENWQQATERTVNAIADLGNFTENEKLTCMDQMLSQTVMVSGRYLWVGGTKWAENSKNFYGAYNCSNILVECWDDFRLLMNLAMQGCGTGALLEDKFISKLPPITNTLDLNVIGKPGDSYFKLEETEVRKNERGDYLITVGDSREGWCEAYKALMEIASYPLLKNYKIAVNVDISNVREAGKKLKGFGGTANPIRLGEMFERVAKVINRAVGRQLTATECCLIIDEAAACVVAGNIRRCLPHFTRVTMADGMFKPISEIMIGDLVKTPLGSQKVTDVFEQGIQQCYTIVCQNGNLVQATANHRFGFYSRDDGTFGWVHVKDVKPGYKIVTQTGNFQTVASINKTHEFQTFDIEVENEHCFYAEGFLSHNSAGIKQAGKDDEEFANCKDNLWQQDDQGNWRIDPERDALRMSNHTRVYHNKPSFEEIKAAVTKQFYSGEGAIQYAPEAIARANADVIKNEFLRRLFIRQYEKGYGEEFFRKRIPGIDQRELDHRMTRYGFNPCAEIVLNNNLCNLGEVHLNRIHPEDSEGQIKAFITGALFVCALLHHKFVDEKIQYSREIDPIVGVSFTGLFDFFVKAFGIRWLKWWEAGRPLTDEGKQFKKLEKRFLNTWREAVRTTVESYCKREGLKVPNRFTTVQPSGSKSLLTGASPGWHPPKAARYIRRITFAKNDPVALAYMDLGYSIVPSQSDKDENGVLLNDPFDSRCTEWLVEIPFEMSWANIPGVDDIDINRFSATAQFDFYMQVQKYYSTHTTSATIEFREDEIDPLSSAIFNNIYQSDGYISAALLPRSDAPYPRLPFEKIDKETYERLQSEVLARRKTDDFHSALMSHDNPESLPEGSSGCDSDKCFLPLTKPE
jgi:adenosylcobalamin-dependent ribonucleoside-triphosphate reductase